MDDLAADRSLKKEWTPEDALDEARERIKAFGGRVMVSVVWYQVSDDLSRELHFSTAGLTTPEHITLLALGQDALIQQWKKGE